MWKKVAYALIGFFALGMISQAHVVPVEPPRPPTSQPPETRVSVSTSSKGDYRQVSSDFYLVRKTDFDRTVSVTVEVIGANTGPAKPITMFVTFLRGEREQLVAIRPIIRDFFPNQPTFVRIFSDIKSS